LARLGGDEFRAYCLNTADRLMPANRRDLREVSEKIPLRLGRQGLRDRASIGVVPISTDSGQHRGTSRECRRLAVDGRTMAGNRIPCTSRKTVALAKAPSARCSGCTASRHSALGEPTASACFSRSPAAVPGEHEQYGEILVRHGGCAKRLGVAPHLSRRRTFTPAAVLLTAWVLNATLTALREAGCRFWADQRLCHQSLRAVRCATTLPGRGGGYLEAYRINSRHISVCRSLKRRDCRNLTRAMVFIHAQGHGLCVFAAPLISAVGLISFMHPLNICRWIFLKIDGSFVRDM